MGFDNCSCHQGRESRREDDGIHVRRDGEHALPSRRAAVSSALGGLGIHVAKHSLHHLQREKHPGERSVEPRRHARRRPARQQEPIPLGDGARAAAGSRPGALGPRPREAHADFDRRSLGPEAVPRPQGDRRRDRLAHGPELPLELGEGPPGRRRRVDVGATDLIAQSRGEGVCAPEEVAGGEDPHQDTSQGGDQESNSARQEKMARRPHRGGRRCLRRQGRRPPRQR
mmetsp:Transcript_43967/g.133949  ORF Transcript_43967/g.133949 Transcript_43967/m.133949 type:complete len:228 (+) Transcript_43967:390-1073(+)